MDGSSLGNPGNEGFRRIIRKSNRDWVVAFTQYFTYATNIKLVLEHPLLPIKINIDSKEIIIMLKQGNLLYKSLLHKYRLLLSKLGSPLVHNCYKKKNVVADDFAKFGAKTKNLANYSFFVPPSFVARFVWADVEETTHMRKLPISSSGHSPTIFVLELDLALSL